MKSVIYDTFTRHNATVRRIIARYRPHRDDVDELVQETFIKCFSAELKQTIENPKAFIFRVAKNVAISESRKTRYATTDSIEDFGGSDVYTDRTNVSAEDQLLSKQKLKIGVDALMDLSPECRRVLLMRKVDGLKYKQIATRLGVSVSTVEKRLALALLRCNTFFRVHGFDKHDFSSLLMYQRKSEQDQDSPSRRVVEKLER